MNASIHIAVLICVVIIEAKQTDDPNKFANSDLQKDGNHNRGRREQDSSALGFRSKCDGAILSCCADTVQRRKKCFSNFRCAQTYESGTACSKENILNILDSFHDYLSNSSNKEHRQKRWSYYNEQSQPNYQVRRDSNPDQQEQYLPQIVRLLEEITTYVKKPQQVPVPHNVYVPYPIPYPVSQPVAQVKTVTLPNTYTTPYPVSQPVSKVKTVTVPNIAVRGFPIEDGMSWGPVNLSEGEDNDGARPISFVPIKPERSLKRLAPKVEHGSEQSDIRLLSSPSSQVPVSGITKLPPTSPSPCTAAILACCADEKKKQKNCFYNFQCGLPYDNGNACKSESIRDAFESYKHLI